jgi:hypothetical protein
MLLHAPELLAIALCVGCDENNFGPIDTTN